MNAVLFVERVKEKVIQTHDIEYGLMEEDQWVFGSSTHLGWTYEQILKILQDPAGIRALGEVYLHKNLRNGDQDRIARFIGWRLIRYGYWPDDPFYRGEVYNLEKRDRARWEEYNRNVVTLGSLVKIVALVLAEVRLIEVPLSSGPSQGFEKLSVQAVTQRPEKTKQRLPPATQTPLHKAVKQAIVDGLKGSRLWQWVDLQAREKSSIQPLPSWQPWPGSFTKAYQRPFKRQLNTFVFRIRKSLCH